MTAAKFIRLIGGPRGGSNIELPLTAKIGDTITVNTEQRKAGSVHLQASTAYKIAMHPTEGIIGEWLNPADRQHRKVW